MMRWTKLSCGFLAVLLITGCTHQQAFSDSQHEIENQDRVIKRLSGENETLVTENRLLTTRIETLTSQLSSATGSGAGLDSDLAAVNQGMRDLENRLRELSTIKTSSAGNSVAGSELGAGVRVKPHHDGVAVEVAETVLFRPGKAELTNEGRSVLGQIASRLKDVPGDIRVEGHTDNSPVVVHAKDYPMGNLQLSGLRALEVANYLIHAGGLPPTRVAYAGFGEHRPLVPNRDAESMGRNRRVEIVIVKRD